MSTHIDRPNLDYRNVEAAMAFEGLIPNDTVIELVNDAGSQVAIGLAVAGQGGLEATQVQRWLFKRSIDDLYEQMPPEGKWTWRVWSAAPTALQTLTGFRSHVSQTFVQGQYVYARANCKHTTALANSESDFPSFLPPDPGGGSQNDGGTLRIKDTQGSAIGYAWARWKDTLNSFEEWALPSNYSLSGGIVVGRIDYDDFKSLLTQVVWTQGNVVLASVRYYDDLTVFGTNPL